MEYDYSKLIGRIIEICGSQAAFAKLMDLSTHSISAKLNNKSFWTQPEMEKAAKILKFRLKEIQVYFFTPKVQAN